MLVADPKTYLWQNICLLMKSESPTVDAVQLKTKVGRGTVQRIKEGQTSIGTDKLLAIAEAFDIKLSELLQPDLKPQIQSTASTLPYPAPSLADTLTQLGQVIAASDKLTRAQIKPILDQLLETPEQAAELGARLEATIAIQQRPETSLPTPTADQVLTAKPIIRTSDFAPKVPAKP